MIYTIYDAVDVAAIPIGAQFILAYIDGGYVTYAAARKRFPNARIITITTNGLNKADICDVESGDATPAVAAVGVRKGLYSILYSDVSTEPALNAACAGLVWYWYAAHPTGVPHLEPGSIATQWAWPGHGSPGNYDISMTNGIWLVPAPPVVQPPAAVPTPIQKEDKMFCTDPESGQLLETDADGNLFVPVPIPDLAVTTLAQHPNWNAGATESGGKNPCVGVTPWKDPSGRWGYAYLTRPVPATPNGGLLAYHIARNGVPQ